MTQIATTPSVPDMILSASRGIVWLYSEWRKRARERERVLMFKAHYTTTTMRIQSDG